MTATPDALRHVWAKSARGTEPAETLTEHTRQVIERLAGWRRRYPELPRHTVRGNLWDLAAWACLLHDLGKSANGFQRMLRGGPRFEHRHEVLSLVAVGWLDVGEEDRALVAAGVATHHKDLSIVRQLYPFGSGDRDELLAELSSDDEAAWRRWLGGEGAPDLAALGFSPLPALRWPLPAAALASALRAVLELAARLGDMHATEPLAVTACAARGLVVLSDHSGSAHERLSTAEVLASGDGFRRVNQGWFTRGLEPHQAASGATDGNALLIAPTGSGKTEAALLWAARQHERTPGARVLFYVLPFKASLNAMRRRLPTYGLADEQVVLQHASATSALYRFFLDEKGYTRSEAGRAATHERNLGRLMTAPVRVLTPYQLLRAFFGLKGHEAVLSDAAGGLFVLDELHAYEVERLALILAAVEHLAQRLGAHFFAMSATFPRVLRAALGEALGSPPATILATTDTFRRFQRHRLVLAGDDLLAPASMAQMLERYECGEAVLAVATTVARAQRLFDVLERGLPGGSVALLHSRFTAEDRARKESALAERVGTGRRAANATGTILVATQVVEVSLDVDFDVLFSDPAPLEALIQRFGRVNRALRGGLRDVVVCAGEGPPDGFGVYEGDLVRRALAALRPLAGEALDEALLGERVDSIYEPVAAAWIEDLTRRMQQARDEVVRTNRPLGSHPELESLFERLFDGCEVVPQAKEAEFLELEREDPLRAAFLRVPISDRQRMRLLRAGRLEGEIARVPYDERRGLSLSFPNDAA